MSDLTCEYCNYVFAQPQNLKRHYNRCKKRSSKLVDNQIEEMKKQYERELQIQKEQHERELRIQREQHERELQFLRDQLDEFKTQIFEIAKQPKQNINNNTQTTHNNQRILNITNQLIPMNLSDDDLKQLIAKYYTTDTFLGGPESIAQMTVNHILIDQETGKFRVVCTDTARGIFYFQDADNNLIRDIGMQKIQEKLIAPLNEATRLEFERLEGKNQMNPHKLMDLFGDNLSCIRGNELPNRIKKSVQLPIPNVNSTPDPITNKEQ